MPKIPIIYIILFTLSLSAILGLPMLWNHLPVFPCQKWGFIPHQGTKYYLHPEKIVIEPWRGQHHIYGIFMIPEGYLHDHLITVEIPGKQTYCGILLFPGKTYAGINAKPGYFLMKGYLQTRTALGLIFQGKGNQLQQLINWKLGYSKAKKIPAGSPNKS
jgi:hypothetical protein